MLAAGCALKSRFWCTTQQKVRLKLAFLTPQKRQKKVRFFFYTALQDGSERNKDREANPAGSQMACRPGVFYGLCSNRRGDERGARGAFIALE